MSEAETNVRVDIRHIQLVERAPMSDADDGVVFIALEDPPPVRSIVAVFDDDGDKRALEVTGVVEVPTNGRERGVFGRFIENDALERFAKVGTEHLDDGEPDSEDDHEQAANDDDGGGSMMAIPAPVVDPDDSDPIDLAEVRQIEEDPDGAHERNDGEAASAGADGEPDEGETRRGKRRRGRKRK